jgi:hypothetical protein
MEVFVAWFNMAVLGYGIGTVPGPTGGGGIGVKHTSGMAIQFPPADVEPGNIGGIINSPLLKPLLTEMNFLGLDLVVLFRFKVGLFGFEMKSLVHQGPHSPGLYLAQLLHCLIDVPGLGYD